MQLSIFDESDEEMKFWTMAEKQVLNFVCRKVKKHLAILGIGTCNRSILQKLCEKGYINLVGLNHREGSVEITSVDSEIDQPGSSSNIDGSIEYHTADLVSDKTFPNFCNQFDVIIDMGMWDTICLDNDRKSRLRNYRRSIIEFFKKNEGDDLDESISSKFFLIFSCNFAKDEISDLFECEELIFDSKIMPTNTSHPSKGYAMCTGVVFRKE